MLEYEVTNRMRFGSVCSGIEAASVAWAPLGWKAAWLAEIEKFPAAVLAHHYPEVPNLGDMTALPARIAAGEAEAPDIFCGGTPCQAFSVAGLRKSLDDARGNLSLVFCEIANAIDTARSVCGRPPAVIFYENVPGILSTKDNAFGCFLAGLSGEDDPLVAPGGRWTNAGCVSGPQRTVAWRVLDAQYFGVAQRRRRVFVIASARKGFDPAQVLFEWDGVRRDSAPSREARQVAPTIPARSTAGGGLGTDFDLDGGVITMAHGQGGAEIGFDRGPTLTCNHEAPIAAYTINFCDTGGSRPDRRDGGLYVTETDTSGALTCAEATTKILQQVTRTSANGHGVRPELAHTLDRAQGQCVAFDTTQITSAANYSNPKPGDPCHPLAAGAHAPAIAFPANLSGTQCASTEELAPSMGAANPTAVAFDQHYQPSTTAQTLIAGGSGGRNEMNHPTVFTAAMQVRRLTPTEAERLQGFPDIKKTYTIEVCHEAEKPENVPSAGQSSAALSHAQSRHAAVRVRINLERQEVHLLSPARLNLSANTVGNPSMSRPLMQSADIARLVALMTPHLDRITGVGKGESQANTTSFSLRLSGSRSVQLFGQEIDALASDADKFTSTVSACLKSITSEAGQSSTSYERSLQTLCCCVVAAINSCIQDGTPAKSSYALSIETEIGYTAIPWRGKPADQCPDGPRYRALGNSWAIPCVSWIGERIQRHLAGDL